MLTDRSQKRVSSLIDFAYYLVCALVFVLIFFVLKYTFAWFMPFVIGFIIATALKKPSELLARRLKLKSNKISAYIVLAFFYALVVLLGWLLGAELISLGSRWLKSLPSLYGESIAPSLDTLNKVITDAVAHINPNIWEQSPQGLLGGLAGELGSSISSLASRGVGYAASAATKLPSMLIAVIFTILSSFFFAGDYKKITLFVSAQFSPKVFAIVAEIKGYLFGTLAKYLKSYFIIMCITFAELSIGFTIIGVKNSILIALLVSICDIMPVLGTGTIVIPWMIIAAVTGSYTLAIGLLVIYVVVTIIRNIIEPKIVGSQLGLHPIVTLLAMYFGLRMMGVLGMFAVPITIQIIVRLNKSGTFSFLKLPSSRNSTGTPSS